MTTPLDVSAAVILNHGRLLLATRRPGGHLAGYWEFPGGKVHSDETLADCIQREIHEELHMQVAQASALFSITHCYPEKTIRLWFMRCEIAPEHAEPQCQEGQQAAWFDARALAALSLAPADQAMLDWLRQLPHGGADSPQVIDQEGTELFRRWLLSAHQEQ